MKRSLLQLLVFACLYWCDRVAGQTGCTGTVQGHTYDLTSLTGTADYQITVETGKNSALIRLNMCRPLVNLGQPACAAGASGCQLWDMPTPKYKTTLGLASSMQIVPYKGDAAKRGWTAQFTQGTGWNGGTAQMEIYFLCDPSAGQGTPTLVSNSNNDFKFNWPTNLGCTAPVESSPTGITGGGIFLILLFCGAALYLVIGVVVNKFVRHQSGIEMIPNIAFWTGFLGLIKDGGKFITLKTCKRGGYSQV